MVADWGGVRYASHIRAGDKEALILSATSKFTGLTDQVGELEFRAAQHQSCIKTFYQEIPLPAFSAWAAEFRDMHALLKTDFDLIGNLGRRKEYFGYESFEDRFAGCGGLRLYRLSSGTGVERRAFAATVTFWDADGTLYVEVQGNDVSLDTVEALIATTKTTLKVR